MLFLSGSSSVAYCCLVSDLTVSPPVLSEVNVSEVASFSCVKAVLQMDFRAEVLRTNTAVTNDGFVP